MIHYIHHQPLALSSQHLALDSRLTANGYQLIADVTKGSV